MRRRHGSDGSRRRVPDLARAGRAAAGRLARRIRGLHPWRGLRRAYGAGPGHAAAMACCLAVAGYAAVRLLGQRTLTVAVWLVGAALLHDLLLLPLYSGADRLLQRRSAGRRDGARPLPAVNFVRVPALVSGVLLLVWFPLILDLSGPYPGASGLSEGVYAGRWLAITAGLFALSALLYAARRARRSMRRRRG